MKAKELIKLLQKQNPDDEILLWRWNGEESIFRELNPTLQADRYVGSFVLKVNAQTPSVDPELKEVKQGSEQE